MLRSAVEQALMHWKTLLAVSGVIFGSGIAVQKIDSHDRRIILNTASIQKLTEQNNAYQQEVLQRMSRVEVISERQAKSLEKIEEYLRK